MGMLVVFIVAFSTKFGERGLPSPSLSESPSLGPVHLPASSLYGNRHISEHKLCGKASSQDPVRISQPALSNTAPATFEMDFLQGTASQQCPLITHR